MGRLNLAGFRFKIEVVQRIKAKIKIFMSGSAVLAAFPKPPTPFYLTSIVFKVCQVQHPKQSKRQRCELPETECWPGICYFGSPPAMFWMNGDNTPYDGKPCYTLTDLTTDRAAGERMVEAIRTQQKFTSPDKLLDRALEHVYAAVHQGHPKEDWLAWLCDILVDLPVEPLSSRGKQKLKHRGKGKATALNRAAFVSKLLPGLKRKDEQLLWLEYKKAK
jgi:hypothetical protein